MPDGVNDTEEARSYRTDLLREVAADTENVRVLEAMAVVPRHRFMPGASLARAYQNVPVAIGYEQTISQPSIVAIMSDALELQGRERVLEIGTGSGYQAAILSVLAAEVFSIEVVPELANASRERLARLGYSNVTVRAGDGYDGWPEEAPFDRIIVTAAPEELPQTLLDQLAEGGTLVAPVGANTRNQQLVRYRKNRGHVTAEGLGAVRFVPMVRGDDMAPAREDMAQ
jgi:protein-L-isoaspartate(D-aspartate) O-methyltransferase